MKDVLLGVCGEGINAECLMVVWSICCTILKTKVGLICVDEDGTGGCPFLRLPF